MKSIILYPESDRYVLKRVFKILNSRKLKVDATKIDVCWSLEQLPALFSVLDNYSHIFIILSSENFGEQWLTGLLGYIIGANKGSYFYFTENNGLLDRVFSKFNTGEDYEAVEIYADYEYKRYNTKLRREEARSHLIDTGFALSDEALGECIVSGHLDIVKKYIEAGFSSSSRNSKGVPMLCLAIRTGHFNIVEYLVEIGADINALSDDRNNTPVMDAASIGDLDTVKLLIKQGADLEIKSKNGQTALILAVGHGDVEVSNFLLSAGADYEVKDSLGMSAKSYATLFNKSDILQHML